VSVSETVTLVMTDKALNSLMSPTLKLGGDASIAAGPVGAGAGSNITADFVSFSRSKGVYGGLNLEGSVIDVAQDWNAAYYQRPVTPTDIVLSGKARSTNPERMASDLERLSMRK
jgi:lipid-binding SYLF domain-containing protein